MRGAPVFCASQYSVIQSGARLRAKPTVARKSKDLYLNNTHTRKAGCACADSLKLNRRPFRFGKAKQENPVFVARFSFSALRLGS